jgi:hypothetical protein
MLQLKELEKQNKPNPKWKKIKIRAEMKNTEIEIYTCA